MMPYGYYHSLSEKKSLVDYTKKLHEGLQNYRAIKNNQNQNQIQIQSASYNNNNKEESTVTSTTLTAPIQASTPTRTQAYSMLKTIKNNKRNIAQENNQKERMEEEEEENEENEDDSDNNEIKCNQLDENESDTNSCNSNSNKSNSDDDGYVKDKVKEKEKEKNQWKINRNSCGIKKSNNSIEKSMSNVNGNTSNEKSNEAFKGKSNRMSNVNSNSNGLYKYNDYKSQNINGGSIDRKTNERNKNNRMSYENNNGNENENEKENEWHKKSISCSANGNINKMLDTSMKKSNIIQKDDLSKLKLNSSTTTTSSSGNKDARTSSLSSSSSSSHYITDPIPMTPMTCFMKNYHNHVNSMNMNINHLSSSAPIVSSISSIASLASSIKSTSSTTSSSSGTRINGLWSSSNTNYNNYGTSVPNLSFAPSSSYPQTYQSSAAYMRGLEYLNKKLYQEALAEFTKAIECNPQDIRPYLQRADLLVQLQKYEQAINDYTSVIKSHQSCSSSSSQNIDIIYKRAKIYSKLNNANIQAIADYTTVIKSDPRMTKVKDCLEERGKLFKKEGEYKKALGDFDYLLSLDQNRLSILEERADVYENLLDYKNSIHDYSCILSMIESDIANNVNTEERRRIQYKRSKVIVKYAEQWNENQKNEKLRMREMEDMEEGNFKHTNTNVYLNNNDESQSCTSKTMRSGSNTTAEMSTYEVKLERENLLVSTIFQRHISFGVEEDNLLNMGYTLGNDHENTISTYFCIEQIMDREIIECLEQCIKDCMDILEDKLNLSTMNECESVMSNLYVSKGKCHQFLGKHKEAIEDYRESIIHAPKLNDTKAKNHIYETRIHLAKMLAGGGYTTEALEQLHSVTDGLKISPLDDTTRSIMSSSVICTCLLYLHIRNYTEAQRNLLFLLELKNEQNRLSGIVSKDEKQTIKKQHNTKVDYDTMSLSMTPSVACILLCISRCHILNENYEEGRDAYRLANKVIEGIYNNRLCQNTHVRYDCNGKVISDDGMPLLDTRKEHKEILRLVSKEVEEVSKWKAEMDEKKAKEAYTWLLEHETARSEQPGQARSAKKKKKKKKASFPATVSTQQIVEEKSEPDEKLELPCKEKIITNKGYRIPEQIRNLCKNYFPGHHRQKLTQTDLEDVKHVSVSSASSSTSNDVYKDCVCTNEDCDISVPSSHVKTSVATVHSSVENEKDNAEAPSNSTTVQNNQKTEIPLCKPIIKDEKYMKKRQKQQEKLRSLLQTAIADEDYDQIKSLVERVVRKQMENDLTEECEKARKIVENQKSSSEKLAQHLKVENDEACEQAAIASKSQCVLQTANKDNNGTVYCQKTDGLSGPVSAAQNIVPLTCSTFETEKNEICHSKDADFIVNSITEINPEKNEEYRKKLEEKDKAILELQRRVDELLQKEKTCSSPADRPINETKHHPSYNEKRSMNNKSSRRNIENRRANNNGGDMRYHHQQARRPCGYSYPVELSDYFLASKGLISAELHAMCDDVYHMVSPSKQSQDSRTNIYEFLDELVQAVFVSCYGHHVQVVRTGSCLSETYLPDADMDLCLIPSHPGGSSREENSPDGMPWYIILLQVLSLASTSMDFSHAHTFHVPCQYEIDNNSRGESEDGDAEERSADVIGSPCSSASRASRASHASSYSPIFSFNAPSSSSSTSSTSSTTSSSSMSSCSSSFGLSKNKNSFSDAPTIFGSSSLLFSNLTSFLQQKKTIDRHIAIRNVTFVNAEIKVLKCVVNNISVDFTYNHRDAVYVPAIINEIDRRLGSDICKKSILLVKAWCTYEKDNGVVSRGLFNARERIMAPIHGAVNGGLSTYSLNIMVCSLLNLYHRQLCHPLEVLLLFFEIYSVFDWKQYAVSIFGPVELVSKKIKNDFNPDGDREYLIDEIFIRGLKKSSNTGTPILDSGILFSFPIRSCNIIDPLNPSNNIARGVSGGNLCYIQNYFDYGKKILYDIILNQNHRYGLLRTLFNGTCHLYGHGDGWRPDLLLHPRQTWTPIHYKKNVNYISPIDTSHTKFNSDSSVSRPSPAAISATLQHNRSHQFTKQRMNK